MTANPSLIDWRCDRCGDDATLIVADSAELSRACDAYRRNDAAHPNALGSLRVDQPAHWRVICDDCMMKAASEHTPDLFVSLRVTQILTIADALHWTLSFEQTGWSACTDWHELMRRVVLASLPMPEMPHAASLTRAPAAVAATAQAPSRPQAPVPNAARGTCRSCGAPVLMVRSWKGRYIPIDAEPSQRGTLRLRDGFAQVVPQPELDAARKREQLYVGHAASCPAAAHWRERVGATTTTGRLG